ncbi:MAG: hypothetical protein Q7S63_03065 [bacterium]|nr:hypothetical protein [bacterium]
MVNKVASWYACLAPTESGGRCRNQGSEDGFCHNPHDAESGFADSPAVVLVKFNVNSDVAQQLELAGIQRRAVSWAQREVDHVEHARENSREAYRYREVADSGVPVFGKPGLQSVLLLDLWLELKKAYKLSDIHLLPRRDGKMDVFVLVLSHQQEMRVSASVTDRITRLVGSTWQYVHVWANPPGSDGSIVHTVNVAHRQDTKPDLGLEFKRGLWGAFSA